jgi:DNA end-binding protein Ku
MARPVWRGAISFGLVTVPVGLFTAVRSKDVRFRQLHARTNAPVKQRRVDAETGDEVAFDDIVKGYEVSEGSYVVVDRDELAELDPEASRSIEILDYVDQEDIDPLHYDRPYHLGPDGEHATKPYKLLTEAMEAAGKVAIARFVMRDKEHLAAVRARNGRLVLSTMHFADELVDPADLGIDEQLEGVSANEREVAMAEQLIESMSTDFEPEEYRDEHRERLIAFLEAKAEGSQVEIGEGRDEDEGEVIDLMTALERSLDRAGGRDRRGSREEADEGDGAGSSGSGSSGSGGSGPSDAPSDASGSAGSGRRSGGPGSDDYAAMTRAALYELAQERKLPGRSEMTKSELVDALRASDADAGAA